MTEYNPEKCGPDYMKEDEQNDEQILKEITDSMIKNNLDFIPINIDVKPEPQIDVKSEHENDVKPDDKPEPQNDVKPEPQNDVKSDVKSDVSPDVKPDIKFDVKPDVKPEPQNDIKPDIKPDVKPDIKPNVETQPVNRFKGKRKRLSSEEELDLELQNYNESYDSNSSSSSSSAASASSAAAASTASSSASSSASLSSSASSSAASLSSIPEKYLNRSYNDKYTFLIDYVRNNNDHDHKRRLESINLTLLRKDMIVIVFKIKDAKSTQNLKDLAYGFFVNRRTRKFYKLRGHFYCTIDEINNNINQRAEPLEFVGFGVTNQNLYKF